MTRRAFSISERTTLLGASASTNRSVMPTLPWSAEGLVAEATTSTVPSIMTPPFASVSATRVRLPTGNGSAIGTNTPLRSTYRRNAATNSSTVEQAETR